MFVRFLEDYSIGEQLSVGRQRLRWEVGGHLRCDKYAGNKKLESGGKQPRTMAQTHWGGLGSLRQVDQTHFGD